MKVGIHPERYGRVSDFVKRYEEILKYNSIECEYLSADDPDFFNKLKGLDAFIYRWYHYDYDKQLATTILPIARDVLKLKTFPDNSTDWHFDDKIKQYYLMMLNDFPMCKSWIFWEKKKATEWAQNAMFPLVFKLKGGAGSQNVVLVKSKRQAIQLINRMFGRGITSFGLLDQQSTSVHDFRIEKYLKVILWKLKRALFGIPVETVYQKNKNYVLFQDFLPGNTFDTRVTVIGNRAFAFRRFNRVNDFRSSGSGFIDHDSTKIDIECIKIAFEVSSKLEFQSMAYDFLYDKSNNPKFVEISYSYLDTAIYKCPGHWDRDLKWHEGHLWPQFCQLQDLLSLPDLKQPSLAQSE